MNKNSNNVRKWDSWWSKLNKPTFGDSITYKLGSYFLSDCLIVEDWGVGGGGFKTYRQNAIGVDGSDLPFADKKFIDLTNYVSNCDGIFIKHVLEHNYEWQKILRNLLNSAQNKICVVMFIPFSDNDTEEIAYYESIGVPELSISKTEFYSILNEFDNIKYSSEEYKTDTQYNYEHVIYIEKLK